MASGNYPDFATSHAPDFVSNILKIPGMYNEMGNANARTAIAQQQAATQRWLAEIEARKKEQEMANEPREQDRKDKLAAANIAESGSRMTRSGFENMMTAAQTAKLKKDEEDRTKNEATAAEFNTKLTTLQPWEYAGEQGTKLLNDYGPKFTDPTMAPKVFAGFGAAREPYRNAVERNDMHPDDLALYQEMADVNKLDEGQAMAMARQQATQRKDTEAAQKQILIEQAKYGAMSNRPDLTRTEELLLDDLMGKPPKHAKASDYTPQQRSTIALTIANELISSRLENRRPRQDVIDGAWDAPKNAAQSTPYIRQLFPKPAGN
ncbi:MAG: hypothetical protein QOJ65_1871 [Fimbriimonadaceae bacterium]|jgi:hypothetical protein|nr:hypothetical protein [Fimbriimonadaceae bacterium]